MNILFSSTQVLKSWNNVVMNKLILLLLLVTLSLPSFAVGFKSKLEAEVTKFTDTDISFKITEQKKINEESFPVGTVIHGAITKHRPNRRVYRDEYYKLQLDTATLPNGTVVKLDQGSKIRPRKFLNPQMVGIGAIAATGGVLGITIDMLTLGLPIVRGGLAVWDAGYEVYDTPQGGSKWKSGFKGFMDGALFPLPQIFMKARKTGMETGTKLTIYPAKDGKTVYISVPRRDTRIEKHRESIV